MTVNRATLERVERLLAEADRLGLEGRHLTARVPMREAASQLRGLLAEPQSREEVCEVCEEPVRDLGFIVHPEEGTSICHRCAYELVAAEAKLLREICRTNGWPDLAEPQADDEDQRRENFEQLVTDILVSLDPFLTLLDGPDVDQARESVMRELLAEFARLAQVAEGEESREPRPLWCPVCHNYHVDPGEKTDAGRVTRSCPRSPRDAVWNQVEVARDAPR